MNFFFDKRLGYLVKTPGLDTPLESLEVKAGDGLEVVLQYGTSPDSSVPSSVITAPSWTAESLPGGATMTLGIKEEGDYSDGDLLASVSSWTHDAGADTYTAELDLNTTEINTLLQRDDADDTDDVAAIENAQLELTFTESGGGKPRSSINDVTVTIKHDILLGGEGTPTNAGDPDEYLLKTEGIEFLSTVTSQIGGTSADLDNVVTTTRTAGDMVAFVDADTSDALRVYKLESGTDAESAPDIIRPDDYAASTNEKVWKQKTLVANSLLWAEMRTTSSVTTSTASAWAKVSLDAGTESDTGMVDTATNNRIDLTKDGTYQVNFSCGSNSSKTGIYTAAVYLNGTIERMVQTPANSAAQTVIGGSFLLPNASNGDYLELYWKSDVTDHGLSSSASYTFLDVVEIL